MRQTAKTKTCKYVILKEASLTRADFLLQTSTVSAETDCRTNAEDQPKKSWGENDQNDRCPPRKGDWTSVRVQVSSPADLRASNTGAKAEQCAHPHVE